MTGRIEQEGNKNGRGKALREEQETNLLKKEKYCWKMARLKICRKKDPAPRA
jgi:hypothetical protein